MHPEPHPHAGHTVTLTNGAEFEVDDWADRLFGRSWMLMDGNPAALTYAMRAGTNGLPVDDEVLGGKWNGDTTLIHVSEVVA